MTRRKGGFATTRWSVVLAAAAGASTAADHALATLCESYWYPLYAFVRRRGYGVEAAQDLTQAFFARVIEKRSRLQADPTRGRFRSFLLSSLEHFMVNEWERERALKRGGGAPMVSLDLERAENRFQSEPVTDVTPDRVFDRTWALTLLDRALARLRADLERAGKSPQFERLVPYLSGDLSARYAETARELGITEGAVKVAVHRLRRQFADAVRDEIAHTVSSPEELDDELLYLRRALSN